LLALSKAFVKADQWLYGSISSACYSRNDSTISFDFGGFAVFLNEIVLYFDEYLFGFWKRPAVLSNALVDCRIACCHWFTTAGMIQLSHSISWLYRSFE